MTRMSEEDVLRYQARGSGSPLPGTKAKKSKYRNQPVHVAGRTFDSKAEAERYSQLLLLEQAGEISDLRCQHIFPLTFDGPFGTFKRKYIADFTYRNRDGAFVVEDVKSPVTRTNPEYRIKRELMAVLHGIKIQEITAKHRRGIGHGR